MPPEIGMKVPDRPPNGKTYSCNDKSKRPNMIMFMPDQLRYDALGFTGNKHIRTPYLDAFAKKSATFTNCYAQNSVCAQSRCSIFLGQYPHVSGHRSLDFLIQPGEPDLFQSLKEDGYHIAHLSPRGHMYGLGVTEERVHENGYLVEPGVSDIFRAFKKLNTVEKAWARLFYAGQREEEDGFDFDEAVTRGAELWLDQKPPEPFVLFLPLIWPHCPFECEEPYFSMYKRSEMPEPVSVSSKTGHEPRYMQEIRSRYGLEKVTKEMWQEITATYYGMITRLDDQFGRIMKVLNQQTFKENTVTMFFTDHGEYLGDHGLIEKWPSGLSDVLVKEPLIIGGAGIPEGVVVDAMTEMVDLLPTVLELAKCEEKFPHNGKSLMPLIIQIPGYAHKPFAFSEGGFTLDEEWLLESGRFPYDLKSAIQHDDTEVVGKVTSCRSKNWTYIYRLYEESELYDRRKDHEERHNLAGLPQYEHVVSEYRSIVFRWLVESADLISWKRDVFRPDTWKVDLPHPRVQLEERLKSLGMPPVADHPLRTE